MRKIILFIVILFSITVIVACEPITSENTTTVNSNDDSESALNDTNITKITDDSTNNITVDTVDNSESVTNDTDVTKDTNTITSIGTTETQTTAGVGVN